MYDAFSVVTQYGYMYKQIKITICDIMIGKLSRQMRFGRDMSDKVQMCHQNSTL